MLFLLWMANLDLLTLGTDSEKKEGWHDIGGGNFSDSELLYSMDGGRALQLKHEINVESTIIDRGTTKRDRLINMNLESGWLTAASWRLSGRGGACYRNLFSRCM